MSGTDTTETDDEPSGPPGPPLPPLPRNCDGDMLVDGTFDPNEVYLAGTLIPGAACHDAIAHWSTPHDALAGFGCYFSPQVVSVRPTDGRLIYTNTFEDILREFHCDACPVEYDSEYEHRGDYPKQPLSNDTALVSPMCEADVGKYLLSPEGEYLYRCQGGSTWYDTEGQIIFEETGEGELSHLGYGDMGLVVSNGLHGIVDLQTGTLTPFEGLPYNHHTDTLRAVRADSNGGFYIVIELDEPELWHVSADGGVATSLGLYPPTPGDFYFPPAADRHMALDGCNALYQITTDSQANHLILRRELGGTTQIVYDESYDPFVKIHISSLVTGP